MNCYEFMLEYIRILTLAKSRGYQIDDSKLAVLKYEDEIKRCAAGDEPSTHGLKGSCQRFQIELDDVSELKQDAKILRHLGIDAVPALVLWDKDLGTEDLIGYTACFVDEYTDCSRYEPVWFKAGTTYQEALTQTKKQYDGIYHRADGLRLEGCVERHCKIVEYRGYPYSYTIKEV